MPVNGLNLYLQNLCLKFIHTGFLLLKMYICMFLLLTKKDKCTVIIFIPSNGYGMLLFHRVYKLLSTEVNHNLPVWPISV